MNTQIKLHPVLSILLVVLGAVWLRVGWVLWYPYNPITIHSINIVDDDNTVTAGEPLNYETLFTKHIPICATVRRKLVNSYILSVPPYNRQMAVGKGRSLNQIQVPEFAAPGIYHLEIDYDYEVSQFPHRTVTVSARSGEFRVVEKKQSH